MFSDGYAADTSTSAPLEEMADFRQRKISPPQRLPISIKLHVYDPIKQSIELDLLKY